MPASLYESGVYRRHILTYKDGPHAERVNVTLNFDVFYGYIGARYEQPLLWAANILWEATWSFLKMEFCIQMNLPMSSHLR